MASLNFLPTKTRLWLGAINSPKPWVKLVFLVGLCAVVAMMIGCVFFPRPDISWKLQTNSVIGQLANPLGFDWVIQRNDVAFFNTQAGQTVAINQKTGKVVWLRQTDADSPFPPFFIDDHTIGILTLSGEVFAFNVTTGETQWIFEPEKMTQPDTLPLIDGEMIYFADRNGLLRALNKKTGQLNWQLQFETLPISRAQSETVPLIHFGLMNQSENLLIINHSPEQALITIDKKTSQRVKTVPQQKFQFQIPELSADGTPKLSEKNHQKQQNNLVLCESQTALCKSVALPEKTQTIQLDVFQHTQQQKNLLKMWLPKFSKPLAVTGAPKNAFVNQPIDWDFNFRDATINNLWSEITADLILEEKTQHQKITLRAYPLDNHRWRATAKLPSEGEWSWKLTVTSPTQKQVAQGNLSVSPAPPQTTYSWPGLGFQDALIDLNSNTDYFDQLQIGLTQQPPKDLTTTKFTDLYEYLQHYANPESGFTAFRWSVDNFNFSMWREITDTNFQLSLKGGQNGDTLVRSLAEKNLSIDLDVFGFKPPFLSEQKLTSSQKVKIETYLKYMVGRYGAFVTSWEIGNEVTPSDAWIREVAAILKKVDPYQHPISINWERDQKLGLDFTSLHHYFSIKPNEAQGEFLSMIEPYKNTQQAIIFSELGNADVSWDLASADRFRIRLWTAFMSQTPVFFWAQNGPLFSNPANNANVYLGPTEKTAVATFRKLTLSTSPEWISLPAESTNPQLSALALQNKDTLWIYVANTKENSLVSGPITIDDRQNSAMTWYDPATGRNLGTTTTFTTPVFKHDIIGITKKEP